jgi:hypothetical protein
MKERMWLALSMLVFFFFFFFFFFVASRMVWESKKKNARQIELWILFASHILFKMTRQHQSTSVLSFFLFLSVFFCVYIRVKPRPIDRVCRRVFPHTNTLKAREKEKKEERRCGKIWEGEAVSSSSSSLLHHF